MARHTVPTAEEGHIDADEPPDHITFSVEPSRSTGIYKKSAPPVSRRTSLLTQQLHSGHSTDDNHDIDDVLPQSHPLVRGPSASSGHSVPSTYELISDNDTSSNGLRTASPSPPPQTAHPNHDFGMTKRSNVLAEPLILGQDSPLPPAAGADKLSENDRPRRRCITFACDGGLDKSPVHSEHPHLTGRPTLPPKQASAPAEPPLKRKCTLTFACPTRQSAEDCNMFAVRPRKSTTGTPATRVSPMLSEFPFPASAQSGRTGDTPGVADLLSTSPNEVIASRDHRGSDATIRNESFSVEKKNPMYVKRRTYSVDLHKEPPETPGRFHAIGPDTIDEGWAKQEIDMTRGALTMRDCLHKENLIRKLGEEADQEAIEDEKVYGDRTHGSKAIDDHGHGDDTEDEDDHDRLHGGEDEDDEPGQDDDDENEESDTGSRAVSDAGFDSDDEGGFQDADGSDDDDDDSDYEWWTPGSLLKGKRDQAQAPPSRRRSQSVSSLDSHDDVESTTMNNFLPRGRAQTAGKDIPVGNKTAPPDTADFVCGTLDEDTPLEQVYMSELARRRAAKAKKEMIRDLRSTNIGDGTSSPRLDDGTSGQGSFNSRANKSGASRHVSRDPSPFPGRTTHSSAGRSRHVSREPSPFPNRNLHSSGAMAGRTKNNRSPAPNCRGFLEAASRRLRSPGPLPNYWQAESPQDGRRLSDPGTPAQPIAIPHRLPTEAENESLTTLSLTRATASGMTTPPRRTLRWTDADK